METRLKNINRSKSIRNMDGKPLTMIVTSGTWYYRRLPFMLMTVVMTEYYKMNMNYFCNQKKKVEIKNKAKFLCNYFLKKKEKIWGGKNKIILKIGKLILITPFKRK